VITAYAAIKPSVRRVIVEYTEGNGWMTLDMETGDVHAYPTPAAALAAIKREDAKRSQFSISVIEWGNVPEGFVKPE
jgi:hypothetical protein